MTDTVPANATPLPSRRTLIAHAGMLASIGAAGATMAMPALAHAPGPIEAMWPEYLRLEAEYGAAAERGMDAEALYEEPERPKWNLNEEGGYCVIPTGPGRALCVIDDSDANIARLKELVADEHAPDTDDGTRNKVVARRARKTLAKLEAWQAEMRRRKDAAGLVEADAAELAATKAANAHRDAIFAIEATTIRELAFQAAILQDYWSTARAERVIERLTEFAGVAPYSLGA